MTSATPPVTPSPSSPGSGTAVPVQGDTDVLPTVVQKVTAFAAREIPGVVALGGGSGASRAAGALRQSITGSSDTTSGVKVDMQGDTATVALEVAIEYGVGAKELVRALRRHVPQAVEEIAGVIVTKLDITVTDVHLPGEDVQA